jgi:glycerol-3-phosphate dehydrogenase
MQRELAIQRVLERETPWDILIIGGGATGASLLLDAATRGYSAILLEQYDFGKGTSSRSTKLVHGGVRYLAQGNISLVREALRERSLLRRNAPHVVQEMSFLVPCRNLWQRLWYGIGFKAYDLLAARSDFRPARSLRRDACLQAVSTLRPDQVAGGVLYSDGQFDDTRLLIDILQTAIAHGGIALNYFPVTDLIKNPAGQVTGVAARDSESGQTFTLTARVVINATGPFCDRIRQQDSPHEQPLVTTSQGIHVVLPKRFLPGNTAVIVPKTSDGRVIFLIPWLDHVVVGTTDTPLDEPVIEPRPQTQEVEFLLKTAAQYLTQAPTVDDILSVFTGIRPLVRPQGNAGNRSTSRLSRDHTILRSPSGLVTITGGKWTTARKMAEDCLDRASAWSGLPHHPSRTVELPIQPSNQPLQETDRCARSNDDSQTPSAPAAGVVSPQIEQDPPLTEPLVPGYALSRADVLWSIRHQMARTIEDVLARRSRLLFLNVAAARQAAPAVADLLMQELHRDHAWRDDQRQQFFQTTKAFEYNGPLSPTAENQR